VVKRIESHVLDFEQNIIGKRGSWILVCFFLQTKHLDKLKTGCLVRLFVRLSVLSRGGHSFERKSYTKKQFTETHCMLGGMTDTLNVKVT